MATALIILVASLLAAWLFLRWFERANVFQPSRSLWSDPSVLGIPFEDVRLTTADGVELSAWFLPAAPESPRGDLAVLISHGNGGNISHRLSLCGALAELGLNILLYDYRGYGRSSGRCSEHGTYLDAEAALNWLNTRGFNDSAVLAYGESLGGGVAAELARRRPNLRALVLQSTFTSIPDIGEELFPFLPVRMVGVIRYDTRAKLPEIRVPILILHSRDDTLIRFHHAERNFEAANPPKWLREIRGDHNEQPGSDPEGFRTAILELLTNTGGRR